MRLKDVDALKAEVLKNQYTVTFCLEHGIERSISLEMLWIVLDNAPTVEPQTTELEEHFYHRCGFLQGMEEGKKLTRQQGETNAEIFKQTFGFYATEVWSMSEREFLEWLNSEAKIHRAGSEADKRRTEE